jgi:hypothetical protein
MRLLAFLMLCCLVLAACAGPSALPPPDATSTKGNYEYLAATAADLEAYPINRHFGYVSYTTFDAPTLGLYVVLGGEGKLRLRPTGIPLSWLDSGHSLSVSAPADTWPRIQAMGGFQHVRHVSAFCADGSSQELINWLAAKSDLRNVCISMRSYDNVSLLPLKSLRGPLTLKLRVYPREESPALPTSLLHGLHQLRNLETLEIGCAIDADNYNILIELLSRHRFSSFFITEQIVDDPALLTAALSHAGVVQMRVTQNCLESVAGSLTPDQTFGVEGLYLEVPVGARDAAMEIARRCPRLFDLSFKWTRP